MKIHSIDFRLATTSGGEGGPFFYTRLSGGWRRVLPPSLYSAKPSRMRVHPPSLYSTKMSRMRVRPPSLYLANPNRVGGVSPLSTRPSRVRRKGMFSLSLLGPAGKEEGGNPLSLFG